MLAKYFENVHEIYDHVDSIIIINKDGIVEYSVINNKEINSFVSDDFIGKHVFEVYPNLTTETSNHYRVLQSGQPILNETQELEDLYGRIFTFVNSTFPMEHNDEIIGTIEFSILISLSDPNQHQSEESQLLGKATSGLFTLENIITANPAMVKIKENIRKIATNESSVIIYGDTGTGKELVAQSIHSSSQRSNGPFVSLNCSTIPANILESILFGSVKGSFTGAENKKGLFEKADGGTLFLDELNSMEVSLQAKILKAIEENKIRPVGGNDDRIVDIRYVAAMNIPPLEAVKSGVLRRDLYYRLNVIPINLPSLLDRKEDINLLILHFLKRFSKEMNSRIEKISDIAMNTLALYSWPGNVRELKNVMEYAFNVALGDTITLKDLPENIVYDEEASPLPHHIEANLTNHTLKEIMNQYEKSIIMDVLNNSSNRTETAKKLGITRQALQYKMDRLGIEIKKTISGSE